MYTHEPLNMPKPLNEAWFTSTEQSKTYPDLYVDPCPQAELVSIVISLILAILCTVWFVTKILK